MAQDRSEVEGLGVLEPSAARNRKASDLREPHFYIP
jgi:hypothetical protein